MVDHGTAIYEYDETSPLPPVSGTHRDVLLSSPQNQDQMYLVELRNPDPDQGLPHHQAPRSRRATIVNALEIPASTEEEERPLEYFIQRNLSSFRKNLIPSDFQQASRGRPSMADNDGVIVIPIIGEEVETEPDTTKDKYERAPTNHNFDAGTIALYPASVSVMVDQQTPFAEEKKKSGRNPSSRVKVMILVESTDDDESVEDKRGGKSKERPLNRDKDKSKTKGKVKKSHDSNDSKETIYPHKGYVPRRSDPIFEAPDDSDIQQDNGDRSKSKRGKTQGSSKQQDKYANHSAKAGRNDEKSGKARNPGNKRNVGKKDEQVYNMTFDQTPSETTETEEQKNDTKVPKPKKKLSWSASTKNRSNFFDSEEDQYFPYDDWKSFSSSDDSDDVKTKDRKESSGSKDSAKVKEKSKDDDGTNKKNEIERNRTTSKDSKRPTKDEKSGTRSNDKDGYNSETRPQSKGKPDGNTRLQSNDKHDSKSRSQDKDKSDDNRRLKSKNKHDSKSRSQDKDKSDGNRRQESKDKKGKSRSQDKDKSDNNRRQESKDKRKNVNRSQDKDKPGGKKLTNDKHEEDGTRPKNTNKSDNKNQPQSGRPKGKGRPQRGEDDEDMKSPKYYNLKAPKSATKMIVKKRYHIQIPEHGRPETWFNSHFSLDEENNVDLDYNGPVKISNYYSSNKYV